MKAYPRLRIRKLPYEDGTSAWTVLLLRRPAGAVKHWRCFGYDHARLIAPQIWATRAKWLDR